MTRYDAGQKDETRKRILCAASRLFRERGIKATTVPDIMRECGLTVGGFYKHFDSKEDLFRAALHEAIGEMRGQFAGIDPALRGEAWRTFFARHYLTEAHRDNLLELDVNPLMVLKNGAVAVDALVVLA